MKRAMSVALAVVLVGALAGVAFALGPGMGRMGDGMPMMGSGMPMIMGPGMMGGAAGPATCPGWAGTGATAPPAQITEEKAKEIATEYVGKYLKGFTVERVLPFAGMHHTMFQVELKGPKGETRVLHVTPWGGVRPFGPPVAG